MAVIRAWTKWPSGGTSPGVSAFREQAAFRECFPVLDKSEALYGEPEHRAKIADAAQALNGLDAAIRNKRRPNDSDLLETGRLRSAT